MSEKYSAHWGELLKRAVTEPGTLSEAYTAFYSYSIGNQIAAWSQCEDRKIKLGPINTYKGWQALGRQVRRGEKAIWLCQPMTGKRENKDGDREFHTFFMWRPHWFVLAQTDGETVVPPVELPEWSEQRALQALQITKGDFDLASGNTLGYASGRTVHISPLSPQPWKTLFHELAHIVLEHTDVSHKADTPRSLREVEADAVALILCEVLKLEGADECRGYIQHWIKGDTIPDASAQKVFTAANRILRAGQPVPEAAQQEAA